MADALIGHSGFVGTTLKRQRDFESVYRSADIADIRGRDFSLVVCAGAPAQKWIANREPERDRANLEALADHLTAVRCERFVLISTIDVFEQPVGVDEDSVIDDGAIHAYGRNRRMLERFVEQRFARHLIVRLPGLVGPGLRKNVIFDFLNGNQLEGVESRGVFQFYPMVNLWRDLHIALARDLRLVHLTAEPISVADIAFEGFGMRFARERPGQPARYDMRSKHAALFGGTGHYQYSRRETLLATRAYAQSEPVTLPTKAPAP